MYVRINPRTDWDSTYVPHGIETKTFHPIDKNDKMKKFSKKVFGNKKYDFVVFWNNRNIRRKLLVMLLCLSNNLLICYRKIKQKKSV